jgi:hypothetical protein
MDVNRKPIIEIRIPRRLKRERWILKEIFLRVGYPFAFVHDWNDSVVRISYGWIDGHEDLNIREASEKWKWINVPRLGYIEKWPIVCLPGDRPAGLKQNKTILIDIVGMGNYFLSGLGKKAEYTITPSAIKDAESVFGFPAWDIAIKILRDFIEKILRGKGIARIDELRVQAFPSVIVALTHDIDHIIIGGFANFVKSLQQTARVIVNKEDGKVRKIVKILRKGILGVVNYGLNGEGIPFGEAIDVERRYKINSTIFIYAGKSDHPLNPSYELSKEELKGVKLVPFLERLVEYGWDVGLHGSTYSSVSKDLFLCELGKLRGSIRDSVDKNRYHRLSFNFKKTAEILRKSSICVDSSLGFNKLIGFTCGTAFPFYLFNDREGIENENVLEIPITIQDVPLIRKGGKDSAKHIKNTLDFVDRLQECHCFGVLNILWHFETLLRIGLVEDGLTFYKEYLRQLSNHNCSFMTMKEIRKRWEEHQKTLYCV